MDHPETPTPGARRTTHLFQPIRSNRLYNLDGSSPASTSLSEWNPGRSSNTQHTTAPSSQNRVEELNPRAERVDTPRPPRYRPGAFGLGTPFDRGLIGASSNQARPIAAGGSGTNSTQVPRGQSSSSMPSANPSTSASQTSAAPAAETLAGNRFVQRAALQGLRPWDANVIDDRWDLYNDDIYHMDPYREVTRAPARTESASAHNVPSTHTETVPLGQAMHRATQGHLDTSQRPSSRQVSYHAAENNSNQDRPAPVSLNHAPNGAELQEVINLNSYIRQVLGDTGRVSSAYPYPVEAVRHMLYNQVFGNGNGPEPLDQEEASQPVVFRGSLVTRQSVRDDVLAVIDRLIADLIRNPWIEYSESQSRFVEWLEVTSLPEASSNSLETQDKQIPQVPTTTPLQHQTQPTEVHVETQLAHPQPQTITQAAFVPSHTAPAMAPLYATTGPYQGQGGYGPGFIPNPLVQYQPYGPPQWPYQSYPVPPPPPAMFPPPPAMFPPPPAMFPPQQPMFAPMPPMFPPPPPIYHPMAGINRLPPMPPLMTNINHGVNLPNLPRMPNAGAGTMVAPNQPGTSQVLLAPERRQTSGSIYRSRVRTFNVAEWAQDNRPPTPPGAPSWSAIARRATEGNNRVGERVNSAAPTPDLAVMPYRAGSDTMYPINSSGTSPQLQDLTRQGDPSFKTITDPDNIPFEETARDTKPAQWGVMKIGNIPYSLTRQEVVAFLGKNAKIVTSDLGSPIHIIMDRMTGKTMDCYVEFFSIGDAQAAVNAKKRASNPHKLGDRPPKIEMATQDELLEKLFPKAKNIKWEGGVPRVTQPDEPYNSGFKSFVTGEEMVALSKEAEFPQRFGFIDKCPQRPYECMISTLYKFPWHAVHLITLRTRNEIFLACRDQIRALATALKKKSANAGLTESLLEELLLAGLNAPGFNERQRWELVALAGEAGRKVRISPLARVWPFEVLGRRKGKQEDVVEYYVDLLTRHLVPTERGSISTRNAFRTFTAPEVAKDSAATLGQQGAAEFADVLRIYDFNLPSTE